MNYREFLAVLVALLPLYTVGYWFLNDFEIVKIGTLRDPPMASSFKDNANKLLIYQCLNGQECGGLSDRQDGIISAYVLSQIVGVRFGIDMNKPCPLTRYLIPNKVNWVVPTADISNKSIEYWTFIGKEHNYAELSFQNITLKKTLDIIFYRGNINILPFLMKNPLYKALNWTEGLSQYDAIRYIYNRLFKLSIQTEKKLDSLLNTLGERKLFCAHIRTGMGERFPFPTPNPSAVVDFLQTMVKHEPSYTIFLATDSQDVSILFNRTFGSHLCRIDGPIVHVETVEANQQCDGMEKAILDQKVLTYCDTLLMSRSGFSRTAALLRGSDDNLYEVLHHNVTKVSRLDPL